MGDREFLIQHYQKELEALVQDPDQVTKFGKAGRHFTETHYAWDVKARKIIEIYNWVLGRQQEKPDFWAEPKLLAGQQAEEENPLAASEKELGTASLTS
jgi:hypothetical protein